MKCKTDFGNCKCKLVFVTYSMYMYRSAQLDPKKPVYHLYIHIIAMTGLVYIYT